MSEQTQSALEWLAQQLANGKEMPSVFTGDKSNADVKVERPTHKVKQDPSVNNKAVREKVESPVETGVLKLVARPRVFGTRNSGGSRLAKSTLRLGLDTKNLDQIKFEKGLTLSQDIKPKVNKMSYSTADAMRTFEWFEKHYGGKYTSAFNEKRMAYNEAKTQTLKDLGIGINSKGQPIWSDDTQSQKYFEMLKDKSFNYWEIYMSFKPDNVRATQTRKLKILDLKEAVNWFIPELTVDWLS